MPGKRGPWLHWMVSGGKGGSATARTVTDYMAPHPAMGVHRLIFLLFKGAVSEKKIEERITWDLPAFMNTHPNLTPVGASRLALLAHLALLTALRAPQPSTSCTSPRCRAERQGCKSAVPKVCVVRVTGG